MFRIDPVGRPSDYQTYQLSQPAGTHFRKATCAEVECLAHQRGWSTKIDVATELGVKQANYIRLHSGRHFTITEVGTVVTFTFAPGQRCFAEHKVPLERDPIALVRRGDWRWSGRASVLGLADWLDDFAEHQDKIKTQIEGNG